jgi:nitrite reductase/ring-hydroxylating ferredoxin subunit
LTAFPRGSGRAVKVQGQTIALFNLGGELIAVDDGCPHMRASLACGVVRGRTILCGWHGWQFDLDSGACMNVEWAKLRRYPVAIRDGQVVLTYEPEPEAVPEEQPIPQIVWKHSDDDTGDETLDATASSRQPR